MLVDGRRVSGGMSVVGRERLSEAQLVRMWNDLIDGEPTAKSLTG